MSEFFETVSKLLLFDVDVFDLFANIIFGLLYILMEGFLTVIEAFVGAIDVGNYITDVAAQWDLLPDVMVYLINGAGIPAALSIIGWAYVTRFILNIIPATFTRV